MAAHRSPLPPGSPETTAAPDELDALRRRVSELEAQVASKPSDELETMLVPELVRECVAVCGMPTAEDTLTLAAATVARIAGGLPTLAITLQVAQMRAPALREAIRKARKAAAGSVAP